MSSKIPYIDNELELPNGEFSAIIGAAPSKGARSPLLWNAVYEAQNIDSRMLPLDVSSEKLPLLLEWLNNNSLYTGGAVAVPHKQAVAHWLPIEYLDNSAQGIFAVNALFRNKTGQLCGANTDGLAAKQVLDEAGLNVTDKVVVLGFGGVSKAIINAIKDTVSKVYVVSRSYDDENAQQLARWLGVELIAPTSNLSKLRHTTVLINATVLGSTPDYDKLSPITQLNQLDLAPLKIAFDVVYNPSNTHFLQGMAKHTRRYNGLRMNLLQAVHGFKLAHPKTALELIESVMGQATQQPKEGS